MQFLFYFINCMVQKVISACELKARQCFSYKKKIITCKPNSFIVKAKLK